MEKFIWARSVPPYSWWPAQVIETSSDESSTSIRIEFFGDKVEKRTCWKSVKPFIEFKDQFCKEAQKKSSDVQVLLQHAVQEAEKEIVKLGYSSALKTEPNLSTKHSSNGSNDSCANRSGTNESGASCSKVEQGQATSSVKRPLLNSENKFTPRSKMKKLILPSPVATSNITSIVNTASPVSRKLTNVTNNNTSSSRKRMAFASSPGKKSQSDKPRPIMPSPTACSSQKMPLSKGSDTIPSLDVPLSPLGSDDDDDELPSFEDLLKSVAIDSVPGEVVWVKYRKYPHWPSLITKINQRKQRVAVKFINCDNIIDGLWVSLSNVSEYPGENYAQHSATASTSPIYSNILPKAIEMTDQYLYRKAANEDIDPYTHFFPNDAPIEESDGEIETKQEEDKVADPTPDLTSKETPSQSGSEDCVVLGQREPQHKPFSKETTDKIRERDIWLEKLFDAIKGEKLQRLLKKYIKDGEESTALIDRKFYSGPFAYAKEELMGNLLQYIIDTFRTVTGCLHMPSWCYTYVIPRIIMKSIEEVDDVKYEKAKETFIKDMITEEEDMKIDRQLCSWTQIARELSHEDT